MDEVTIQINGEAHWLWRAIDAHARAGYLVQKRRNARAAKGFYRHLVTEYGHPRVVVTDKDHIAFKRPSR